ncbi:RnfH family protein [Legionella oakridgensis]|uniref:UPF0125 protein Loa_00435 n=2 Tax=Legionella oakridgensis TaxID=29423 RepID=W0B658_9GAMM|nr:RnfH family protein [Legionella oakridgensis]AHE66013.1 hypothetical protein Loa_00435 [Legionella oakridgensis ATCC 33761 = DSM 21215]ETO94245.1 hypothetical protein LOR_83c23900 [Legionella oakridgensis RV-2-2007]KTD43578.1 Persistence and stress-resistance antitoxin PasI [Legionella oakridgensis]STY15939.1 protein yfjF [Legionella longbeachae]
MVKVEIVYVPLNAPPVHKHLMVEIGTTVAQAIDCSRIQVDYPETKHMAIGIFARQVALDKIVKEGDRIEIYRPLMIDPKEKRRERAKP